MADMGDIAREIIGKNSPILGVDFALRHALVASVQTNSCTITLSGVDISGIKYVSLPIVGATVLVLQNGTDFVVLGSVTYPISGAVIFDSTLGADAALIDTGANAIPAGFYILEIETMGQSAAAVTSKDTYIRFNNDSGANYQRQYVLGDNTSVTGARGIPSINGIQTQDVSGSTSGDTSTWAIGHLEVPNYSAATKHFCTGKNTNYNNAGSPNPSFFDTANQWVSATAINQVTWLPNGGNFKAGSRMRITAR